jgi:hypothetical protein
MIVKGTVGINNTNTNPVNTSSEVETSALGGYGSKRIATTVATTPDASYVFTAIQVTEDAVFSALVGNMLNGAGLALSAGSVIYGRFTSVTLTSGKIIAYMGV